MKIINQSKKKNENGVIKVENQLLTTREQNINFQAF